MLQNMSYLVVAFCALAVLSTHLFSAQNCCYSTYFGTGANLIIILSISHIAALPLPDVKPGAQVTGIIKKIEAYGMFMSIQEGTRDGLLHASEMGIDREDAVADAGYNVGDELKVMSHIGILSALYSEPPCTVRICLFCRVSALMICRNALDLFLYLASLSAGTE